ncbi:hypothetical protein BH10BAC2_BH10BAC2_42970 [soil metagenome]
MKQIIFTPNAFFTFLCRLSILLPFLYAGNSNAQNWLTTGNSGITTSNFIGTTNNADLIFKTNNIEGGRLLKTSVWQFGTTTNFAKIDLTGKLTFGGTGAYQVAGNKYAFQYTGDPDYGLFFNSTNVRYEFRNGSAVPIFYVDANNGNAVFNGTLKVGAYTLPATDGVNGQVLKTNGTGVLSWSNDNNSGGGGANTALSNLTTTAINQSLLPATDNTIDLGSSSKSWRNIYSGNSIYLKGSIVLHSPGTENFFVGNGAGNNSLTGSINTGVGQVALTQLTSGSYNTANGYASLSFNTTGSYNTANGSFALSFNTGGYSNTASGYSALQANTTGGDNTATGVNAMYSNATGSYNTANGRFSMFSNTTGASNTASGANALYSNTTGYSNVAIGTGALFKNQVGSNSVAVGDSALYNSNSFEYGFNVALGSKALYSNTSGQFNTANGYLALYSNTYGELNTANGFYALRSNTSGEQNTANGHDALFYNTTGYSNTATGHNALSNNITGRQNTADGGFAGSSNDANTYCSFFGYDADQTVSTDFTNSMALGNAARITASNQVRIGNGSISSIGGWEPWTDLSDARFKKNIKENVPGLEFINRLRPVTYTMDVTQLRNFLGEDRRQEANAAERKIVREKKPEAEALVKKGIEEKEKIVRTGFVAQEVEAAAKKIGYDFNGVDKPQNEYTPYGLRYSEFVVPLVKAVQELSKINNDKSNEIDELKKQNNIQQKQIDELKAMMQSFQQNFEKCNPCNQQAGISSQQSTSNSQHQTSAISSASLEQNIPNPFNNTTTINYTLPATYTSAKIIVTDEAGKVLKEVNVSGSGKGSLQINASMFASGVYNYSLYAEGKLIGTKKMVK